MTKSDLIEHLCQTQNMPKGKAETLVNTIFDSLEAALRRGERIEIRGFGSFEIREYKPYEGRNPRTGAAVNVRAKRLPFFKVGKELKERVNGGRAVEDDGDELDDDDELDGAAGSNLSATAALAGDPMPPRQAASAEHQPADSRTVPSAAKAS
jgi:integration host factor subunit beta